MAHDLLMLVGDYVEDWEVIVPYQALQTVGHDVDAVCPDKDAGDTVVTAVHDFTGEQTYSEKPGHTFELSATFDDIDAESYDGLVIPGGRAPEYLRTYDGVIDCVQHFFEEDKPVAALCHAPQLLNAAGVIEGRALTSYPAVRAEVESGGGEWHDGVTVDGNLVTGRVFTDHVEWISEFLDVLGTDIQHGEPMPASDD
ncbi:protease I [Natronoarchaeum philippinense]|uniref:Protease I n=1 Tax=Natronoarchaeum philippinense TaxID=558529 RepID=A0A285P7Z2_NATPI|nr:DJ-1/PfpI family protein [Natronoarchaeum philippinense]SNZ17865.1 protease I [Natronoarchaeum philippinense]